MNNEEQCRLTTMHIFINQLQEELHFDCTGNIQQQWQLECNTNEEKAWISFKIMFLQLYCQVLEQDYAL